MNNQTAARTDPTAAFSFGLEIEGIVSGLFSECSGLRVERKVIQIKEGGANDFVHKFPGRVEFSNVTLKRGVAEHELWDWFATGLYDGKVDRRNVSILLFNGDRSKAKRWNLREAYPIKWSAPDMKVDSNQSAIESIELAHDGFEFNNWEDV